MKYYYFSIKNTKIALRTTSKAQYSQYSAYLPTDLDLWPSKI